MNASARASDLIMVASRLVVLMEQEIAILHEMKVADIAELQPEKELLVRAYLEHGRALEEVPGQLATVAPAIKQELQHVLERFRAAAGHNERALRAAHEVNARLVKAVVNAALTAPRCKKTFARKRLNPLTPKDRSSSLSSSNLCFCASVRIE